LNYILLDINKIDTTRKGFTCRTTTRTTEGTAIATETKQNYLYAMKT